MKDVNVNDYKILLVDDDENYTIGCEALFEKKGIGISTINNPEEALEFLKNNVVDVILLDFFMPEMTGEEFLSKLREFDKETVVILQTGYAGEKPQDDMLQELNIQGYYDKTKPFDYLMLMALSAIKTVKLLREIKAREEEKLLRNKKDEYFANKISWITGDIKENLFSMTGSVGYINMWLEEANVNEQDKDEIIKRLMYLKDNMEKVRNSMESLNLSSQKEITPTGMLEMIKELLKLEMWQKKVKLNMNLEETYYFLDMKGGLVPYIICQDIENRLNTQCGEINVSEMVDENNIVIKIQSESELTVEQKDEIRKVAELCENVKIEINNTITEVVIKKASV